MIHVNNRSVTFDAPVRATYLIGDFTDWDERPLSIHERLTIEFPDGAYVEYAFFDAQLQPLPDPDNPHHPKYPWYEYHRALILPYNTFQEPPYSVQLAGTIKTYDIASRFLKGKRTCAVYEPVLPPVATIYIQDGNAFYEKLALHRVAEALLERKEIEPVRLAFLEPHGRKTDYWFNPRYEAFLLEEVLPSIDRTCGATGTRCLWGAPLGGTISVWLAWKHADIFSQVVSQSGCFTADPQGGNAYHDAEWLTAQFSCTERLPVRFYLETGQIEWCLVPNRRFAAMLADKGYQHHYRERPSGHNWATWEQGLAPALRYLFPAKEESPQ